MLNKIHILSVTTKREEIDYKTSKTLEERNWNKENLKNPKEGREGEKKNNHIK